MDFTRADTDGVFSEGDKVKVLVPKEFGGGRIISIYTGGGMAKDARSLALFNLYGVLAYWNGCKDMEYCGEGRPVHIKDILDRGFTEDAGNICRGIEAGFFEAQMESLPYPLKLVSVYCPKTYEDCPGISVGKGKAAGTDIRMPAGRRRL